MQTTHELPADTYISNWLEYGTGILVRLRNPTRAPTHNLRTELHLQSAVSKSRKSDANSHFSTTKKLPVISS